jgi:hypothetical protein
MCQKLHKWLRDNQITNTTFAETIGVSTAHVEKMLYRKGGVSPDLAVRIETATHGAVTAAELLAHLIPPGYSLVRVEGGEPVEPVPPSAAEPVSEVAP